MSVLKQKVRGFIRDEAGSASIEFVVTLPLLIALLAISFEYGRAFAIREALDSAVRDATRFLARAPATLVDDAAGQRPGLQQYFVDRARDMVSDRVGAEMTAETFPDPIVTNDKSDGSLRTPFYEIFVSVSVEAEFSLLSIFGNWIGSGGSGNLYAFTMQARDSARYLGEVPEGDTACSFVRNIHNRSSGAPEC